ncbi:outer membrane beta-barrel protein [Neolewinella lacunae]|uniref:PorT family protein n=1 Tax=Neolewinella lacunae TaxID=1517758 RepID=A0A923PI01_9BACT|nr:outer membrane beta-barrel protein [Neolewinella lacunae]MBC6993644.1 PorT family protein [Neolewinella lacunae]MDN3634728.1 outer membrane beta-barrel protein [Neolewinella lacunae]
MNYRIFSLLAGLLFSVPAFAQVEFGLKAGLATESLQEERFDLSRAGREDLALAISDADYGFQFGALLRIPFSERFGLQTELTFNSAKTDFSFDDPDSDGTQVFRERYNDLNVPLMASWKLAFLRLNAGPVGHFFVSSTSDLMDADGLERTWDSFNLGYTLGGSIDIGKITLDLRYDGNFSKYGEDFSVAGETFRVDQAPKRWIGTLAYRF